MGWVRGLRFEAGPPSSTLRTGVEVVMVAVGRRTAMAGAGGVGVGGDSEVSVDAVGSLVLKISERWWSAAVSVSVVGSRGELVGQS